MGQSLRKFDCDSLSAVPEPCGARAGVVDETRSGAGRPRIRAGARPSARSRARVDGFRPAFHRLQLFLIAAALLLMAMLFVFSLEQRSEEAGLLALGFRSAQVKRIYA